MGFKNVARLLDYATREGIYCHRPLTFTVKNGGTTIAHDGSYFVDASDGPVTICIDKKFREDGSLVNIKKIDNTSNVVLVNADIDGHDYVGLMLAGENLQIQFHETGWYIL